METRVAWFLGGFRRHWWRLIVFALVGFSVAIPRSWITQQLVLHEWEENVANLVTLLGSIVVVYFPHYFITWRSVMVPLPWRRNLVRLGMIFPGFLFMSWLGILVKVIVNPFLVFGFALILKNTSFNTEMVVSNWYLQISFLATLTQDILVGVLDFIMHHEVSFKRAESCTRKLIMVVSGFWRRYVVMSQ